MVRTFFQKLHNLCHEYETHRSQIKKDEVVQKIVTRSWKKCRQIYFGNYPFPECLDTLFETLHGELHQHEIEEPHRVEELPPKLDYISSFLTELQSSFQAVYSLMQTASIRIDQSFKLYHSRTDCGTGNDNAIEGYREKDKFIFRCTGCGKQWELKDGILRSKSKCYKKNILL